MATGRQTWLGRGNRLPDDQYVELAVEVFRMLADPTRVKLLLAMRDGERSVANLAAAVSKPPAATSQHLAKLRLARLVRTRQVGHGSTTRCKNEQVRQLVTDAIYQAEHSGGGHPAHHRRDAGVTSLSIVGRGDPPA